MELLLQLHQQTHCAQEQLEGSLVTLDVVFLYVPVHHDGVILSGLV